MSSTVTALDLHRRALAEVDPEIAELLRAEEERQERNLELIASENIASLAVRQTMSSVLTDKYAEGYPGKRYYGGCGVADQVEQLAIDRVLALFDAEHANVQPHCGAQANMAAYFAFLEPGDTLMAMNLAHGGHLTHGSHVNFSGKFYNIVPYGVREEDGRIDYDEVRKLAREHKPKLIVSGATAYSRQIDFASFAEVAKEVGARHMTDMAHYAGLVAGGQYDSPVPYADIVTSTTHKSLRGPRGGIILCREELAKEIDKTVFPGIQGGPLMHVIAAKAVCFREAATPEFKEYQRQVKANSAALAAALIEEGFRIISGGTDSHLMLVDLRPFQVTGKIAQSRLDEVNITTNKNAIPFDPEKPFVASGLRLGTPAVTTRGMGEAEMREIASLIARALKAGEQSSALDEIRRDVKRLTARFPIHVS